MTYFTTALDLADFPPLTAPVLRRGGQTFYRLTPSTYAWVLQRVEKARGMHAEGKMTPEVFDEVCARLAALQTHAAAFQGFPFPDGEQRAADAVPQTLPPAPREYTDAELDVIALAIADDPDGTSPLTLLIWPCGTSLALTADEVKKWNLKESRVKE